jgi:hypothetical protein
LPGATPIVKEHDLGFMAYDTPSVHGDCSDPYMVGNHVIGLQVAYTGSDSVFMPIYLEDCDDQNSGMGHFSYFPSVIATNLNMPEGVNPIGMLDKHYTGVAKNNYASTIYNERGEEGVPGYLPKSFPSKRVPSALEGVDGKSPWTKHNSDYTRTTSPPMPDFMKFLMEIIHYDWSRIFTTYPLTSWLGNLLSLKLIMEWKALSSRWTFRSPMAYLVRCMGNLVSNYIS